MKNKKISLFVSILFIVLLFFLSYLYRRNRDVDIKNHSMFAIGKIIRFSRTLSSGDYWHYKFTYNDSVYENSQPTHVDYDVKMGDYFLVNFSAKDPEHSKILYTYKLNGGKLNCTDSVWDTIPLSILHSGLKQ